MVVVAGCQRIECFDGRLRGIAKTTMIHVVVGTKAQLIKMAPVMWALREQQLPYRLIITGQHAETMDAMFDDFQIRPPDVVLHRGADVVSLPQMVAWALRLSATAARRRSTVFAGDQAGVVLVHGDAFSALPLSPTKAMSCPWAT